MHRNSLLTNLIYVSLNLGYYTRQDCRHFWMRPMLLAIQRSYHSCLKHLITANSLRTFVNVLANLLHLLSRDSPVHRDARTHTHTRTHARTHTRTYTHTHILCGGHCLCLVECYCPRALIHLLYPFVYTFERRETDALNIDATSPPQRFRMHHVASRPQTEKATQPSFMANHQDQTQNHQRIEHQGLISLRTKCTRRNTQT